jgi:hypothetical protein
VALNVKLDTHGHYRTKDQILAIYDAMAEAVKEGRSYQTLYSICHPLTPAWRIQTSDHKIQEKGKLSCKPFECDRELEPTATFNSNFQNSLPIKKLMSSSSTNPSTQLSKQLQRSKTTNKTRHSPRKPH